MFVIEHEGIVIGAVQFAEVADPMYRHAGIDLFLASSSWGKGLGQEAITTVANYLFEVRAHHRLVLDPAAGNVRALRAYEKVGFRRVGTMRDYERGPDAPRARGRSPAR